MSQKLCARYTLGVRYLYFKRNVEKFGVRVIRSVRVISRKIRYLLICKYQIMSFLFTNGNVKTFFTVRVIYQTTKFVVLISLYVFILNDYIIYFTIYYSAALNINCKDS